MKDGKVWVKFFAVFSIVVFDRHNKVPAVSISDNWPWEAGVHLVIHNLIWFPNPSFNWVTFFIIFFWSPQECPPRSLDRRTLKIRSKVGLENSQTAQALAYPPKTCA